MRLPKDQMWAIANQFLGLYCGTFLTRKEAIQDFRNHNGQKTWKRLNREFCHVVRVRIVPEHAEKIWGKKKKRTSGRVERNV